MIQMDHALAFYLRKCISHCAGIVGALQRKMLIDVFPNDHRLWSREMTSATIREPIPY